MSACATQEAVVAPTAFYLSSPTLADNAVLQQRHGGSLKSNPNCLGENVSPPLQWVNAPAKTRSFVLLMDDQAGRSGLGVSHLVAYGIPREVTSLAEGELGSPAKNGRFVPGKNTVGTTYLGPCPPRGNALQHYVFTLIATDLEPSALPAGLAKDEVLKALQGGRALGATNLVFRYAH
jgi:hypothetical protein